MKPETPPPASLVTPNLFKARVRTPYIMIMVITWLVMCGGAVDLSWELWQERLSVLDNAELTLEYQTRSLSESVAESLAEEEHRLQLIAERPYLERIFHNRYSPQFFDDMRRLRLGQHGPMELRFINAAGTLLATHDEPVFGEGVSLAATTFFQRHSAQFQDFVLNSEPDRPGTPLRFFDMSRSIYDEEDAFLGVVQIRKPVSDITTLFSRDDFGGYEQVVLFDANGSALTAWPPRITKGWTARVPLAALYPFNTLHDQNINAALRLTDRGPFDALVSSTKLANYPYYVATARSYDDVLAGWHEDRNTLVLSLAVVFVMVLLLNVFILHFMRHAVTRDQAVRTFHAAVDQSTVSIIITDTNGAIEYVNPHFTRVTGYTSTEVLGQNPRMLKSGKTPAQVYEKLWDNITDGQTWQGEFQNRKNDGTLYWDSSIISPIRNEDGDIVNFISVQDDISERKEAERLIQHQSQRLNEIIWGTNVGTWEWNVVTGETVFNERWAEICGYTLDELAPTNIQTWANLCHPEDHETSNRLLQAHFAGEVEYYECEARMRHKDGYWVWVLDRGKVLEWDANGQPLRMSGTHSDITQRKEAETKLQESEARFRKLVEQTQQSYFLYSHDRDGVFSYVSPSVENVLGYTPQEFLAHYSTYLTDSSINADAEVMTNRSLQGLETPPYDVEIFHKNGARRILEVSESPLFDDDGKVESIEGIAHDITPQRAAENEVEERNEQLRNNVAELNATTAELQRQANHMAELAQNKMQLSERLQYELGVKDRFFSIVAHDLKSPFTALLGMTQMMVMASGKWSKEQLVEYAGSVNDAGNRVYELLQTLLEWARLQMDGGTVEPVEIALHDVVLDCIDLEMPMAIDKGVDLKSTVSATVAYADENMVRTILRNLITNAVKFTDKGGCVTLSAERLDGMIEIRISDTGVGMSEAQIANVFALDHKTTTTGTAGEPGTGLGLPLCKEMVELNGGAIWIESVPGEGSTFHFTLPRHAPRA